MLATSIFLSQMQVAREGIINMTSLYGILPLDTLMIAVLGNS